MCNAVPFDDGEATCKVGCGGTGDGGEDISDGFNVFNVSSGGNTARDGGVFDAAAGAQVWDVREALESFTGDEDSRHFSICCGAGEDDDTDDADEVPGSSVGAWIIGGLVVKEMSISMDLPRALGAVLESIASPSRLSSSSISMLQSSADISSHGPSL